MNLKSLIKKGESERIEIKKKSLSNRKEIVETIQKKFNKNGPRKRISRIPGNTNQKNMV